MSKLLAALAARAEQTPADIAVTGSHAELTWQQLAAELARVAGQLSAAHTLGMLMANSPAWVVTDLAAIHAGIVNVPLPAFFSDTQLRHVLQETGIDTVITDEPGRIRALMQVTCSEEIDIAGTRCYLLRLPSPAHHPVMDGICKVTYTSGTTGAPRGVRLTVTAIETVATSLVRAAAADSSDRAMAVLPLTVLLENIGSVYVPLLAGAEILVPAAAETGLSGSSRVDPARLAGTLLKYGPTALIVPPVLLKLLVALAQQQALPDSLRFIAVGGAPVGRGLLAAAQSAGLPVCQGYGLSEACSVVAVNTPASNRPGSVGKPLPHVTVRIGDNGEIMVQGCAYAGYVDGPDRGSGELLATGDSGYLDADGYLYVTGRMRECIITPYGRNVSPGWVEAELMSHPAVSQAVVLGDDLPGLVAILVPATAAGHAELDIAVAAVNSTLPDYARIDDWFPASTPFSAGNGELSVGGSPRRAVIEQHYSRQLDQYRQVSHEHVL